MDLTNDDDLGGYGGDHLGGGTAGATMTAAATAEELKELEEEEQTGGNRCYICLESKPKPSETTCGCRGGNKYVHPQCKI